MTANLIRIVSATQTDAYRIRLNFDDQTAQEVDFRQFLTRSLHPDIRAYLDPSKFAAFRLEYGELVWGDYDLCFPLIDLYRNQIHHHGVLEEAL